METSVQTTTNAFSIIAKHKAGSSRVEFAPDARKYDKRTTQGKFLSEMTNKGWALGAVQINSHVIDGVAFNLSAEGYKVAQECVLEFGKEGEEYFIIDCAIAINWDEIVAMTYQVWTKVGDVIKKSEWKTVVRPNGYYLNTDEAQELRNVREAFGMGSQVAVMFRQLTENRRRAAEKEAYEVARLVQAEKYPVSENDKWDTERLQRRVAAYRAKTIDANSQWAVDTLVGYEVANLIEKFLNVHNVLRIEVRGMGEEGRISKEEAYTLVMRWCASNVSEQLYGKVVKEFTSTVL